MTAREVRIKIKKKEPDWWPRLLYEAKEKITPVKKERKKEIQRKKERQRGRERQTYRERPTQREREGHRES